MNIPGIGTIEVFAMDLDINGFTNMVSKTTRSDFIAQFVRDILSGGVETVERHGGSVVSFMGDAFLALLDDAESAYKAVVGIAKDLDRQCEYISDFQRTHSNDWAFAPGGPSLKIGIEYGWVDISTIQSISLGTHLLAIGPAINYAWRITGAGMGNRCHVGPKAMEQGFSQWRNFGPYSTKGKAGEDAYQYWQMALGDIWKEGAVDLLEESYLG
jgi:class 3 adenylate cyclase